MKNNIIKIVFIAAVAMKTVCAEAFEIKTETVDGIEWTYTVNHGACIGTGSETAISKFTSGDVVIPSTLDGYPVTSIERGAFRDCEFITSITIPNGVIRIESAAFEGCLSLKSVKIPNSVTYIGNDSFKRCSSLQEITLPKGIESIESRTFKECGSLERITIPNSVKRMGKSVFELCPSLKSVTIPNSVTNIRSDVFIGCSSLTSVTLSDSIANIMQDTFCGCSSLKSITIPNSVTNIGSSAFMMCSSLTSITIPSSVRSIEEDAFKRCGELTVYTDEGNRDNLRALLKDSGANVKEIIEQSSRDMRWRLIIGCVGVVVLIIGSGFLYIVIRKKMRDRKAGKNKTNDTPQNIVEEKIESGKEAKVSNIIDPGNKSDSHTDKVKERLMNLKELKREGLILEEDYKEIYKKIISEI